MSRPVLFAVLAVGLLGCPSTNPAHQPTLPTEPDPHVADAPPAAADPVFPDEPFRAAQPPAAPVRPFQLPSVRTFTLPSGIEVYLVEQHSLPIISLDLNFDGGSMNDPKNRAGRAGTCMGMLTEGTAELDKIAFNEALADLASGIDSYAGAETQGLSMYTLSKHFDTTFKLFVDTLRRPGFRQVDFDRMIKRSLDGLKQAKASASPVARRLWSNTLYGTSHPFGQITTEASLGGTQLADCRRYHRDYLKPRGARLFVFGDMTEAQIRDHFEGALADWKGKSKPSVKLKQPQPRKGKLFFVDIPGAAQSVIFFAHFGPRRYDADFFANEMVAAILGNSFSSRINMNLREDKGYAYGAFGVFQYTRAYGSFLAGAAVQSSSTWQSVQEIYKEVADLATPAPAAQRNPRLAYEATQDELEREKSGAILSLPGEFATAQQALDHYRNLVYFGLPLDYYDSFVANYQGVTLEQVNAAAARNLHPDDAVILVVGDARAELEQHVVSEVDGKLVKKDEPLLDGAGKPLLLEDGLHQLVKSGALGKGDMVVLDVDGKQLEILK